MSNEDIQRDAIQAAVGNVADRIETERDHLTDLDSAIGDADHGANLDRGFRAAAEEVDTMDDADPADLVKAVGTTLISEVGGASGPLYGGSILSASQEFAEQGITTETSVAFAETYLETVKNRGDARTGAKTMIDALTPAVHTYKKSIQQDDLPPLTALARAVDAAERGVAFTTPIRAEKGRASYLGWRSVGHQDPGATSTLYIVEELLATAEEYQSLEGEVEGEQDASAVEEPDETPSNEDTAGADKGHSEGE